MNGYAENEASRLRVIVAACAAYPNAVLARRDITEEGALDDTRR